MRRGISKQSIKSREFFENIYEKLNIFRIMNIISVHSLHNTCLSVLIKGNDEEEDFQQKQTQFFIKRNVTALAMPFQAFDLKVHFFSSRFRFVTKYFLISVETLLKSFLLKKGKITIFCRFSAISSQVQLLIKTRPCLARRQRNIRWH